jgi:NAD(P)-dependent dehydrogenase (short-subunit alcohol dehydrogenase family)
MSRIALITGGGQGVGAAIAQQFLNDGFAGIVLLDRNAEALAKTASSLNAPTKVHTFCADLADATTPQRAIDFVCEKFGGLDVLVNAAGNTERCSIDDVTSEAYSRLFDVNVKAPIFMMQCAGKVMKARGGGVVINITSMLAHGGPPSIGIYAASKAALVGLSKNVANAWKRDGIRVFALNLGWVNSDGEHKLQTEFHKMPQDWADKIGARMPFGRLILPSDIAGTCGFLVSTPAQMMTGTVIDYEQVPIGVYDSHPALGPE